MEAKHKSINAIQDEIIEEFAFFDDWMDKYEYLISLGKGLPLINDAFKTDDYLIKGCQSRVWLHADQSNENVVFTADSDATITKGIIGLLVRALSNQSAEEVAKADLYFIDKIGLHEHLSPTRSNGLLSMVKQMKLYGLALTQKQKNNTEQVKEKIIEAIKTVFDPEIPVNIYELGLIYGVELTDNGLVQVEMTLTTPMCPVADSLPLEVQEKITAVEGVTDVDLRVVYDPPWDKSKMSDEARLMLDMF